MKLTQIQGEVQTVDCVELLRKIPELTNCSYNEIGNIVQEYFKKGLCLIICDHLKPVFICCYRFYKCKPKTIIACDFKNVYQDSQKYLDIVYCVAKNNDIFKAGLNELNTKANNTKYCRFLRKNCTVNLIYDKNSILNKINKLNR